MKPTLAPLIKELKTMSQLDGVLSLLGWDQETYMPKGGLEPRSEQLALLSQFKHERHTSESFRSLLSTFVDLDTGHVTYPGSLQELSLLKQIHKDWRMACALPTSFIASYAELKSKAQYHWQQAKTNNDYEMFRPYLETLIERTREKARFYKSESSLYGSLIDEHEPGLTLETFDDLFDELKRETQLLLKKIRSVSTKKWLDLSQYHYGQQSQWELGMSVLTDMGFDFDHGRLDKSAHPFTTTFHPNDVRITTRFKTTDPLEGLSGTIHEGGHALYEQGLDKGWYGTPLCEAASFGVHESQARFWENMIGKHHAFWKHYYPFFCNHFPEFRDIPLDRFYQAMHVVSPSLIRVEADEVTYNSHIMIRYELEKALIDGDLKTADLPHVWNRYYNEYLGVTPASDSEGVLQDVHWSVGAFGYFPSYTIGNLYAAQLNQTLVKDIPQYETYLEDGDLKPFKEWLRENVYQYGRQYSSQELLERVTGEPLSVTPFMTYIKQKYNQIYGLEDV